MTDNKSFTDWCLLCANCDNVNVEIYKLNDELKEHIGVFSVLNFSLPNLPSKICESCFIFLNELEKRKGIYAKAEQMFLELVRMRSKNSVDLDKIRRKYEFDDPAVAEEVYINKKDDHQTNDTIIEITNIEDYTLNNINVIDENPADEINYHCDICLKTFNTKVQIKKHIEQIHISQINQCNLCEKRFKTKLSLENHKRKYHKEKSDENIFACDECSKSFKKKGALKEHKKTHDSVKNHICAVCNKAYKTASTLTQHMDTHNMTKYKCTECDLELNTKRTLRQHMLKHSEIAKYVCEFCESKFKRVKTYKEHLISMHTDIKAYQCEWCDRKFSIGANCRKHKKERHADELKSADTNDEKISVELPSIEELLKMCRERLNK